MTVKHQHSSASAVSNNSSSNSPKGAKDVAAILKNISQRAHVIHHSQHQITITCYISTSSVGAVIGRRGSTVLQIQRDAVALATSVAASTSNNTGNSSAASPAVKVSIVSNPAAAEGDSQPPPPPFTYTELDWSSPYWTPVVIRGDPSAALAAARMLRDYATEEMDQVVVDLPLPTKVHSKIIGKKGMTIASTSAEYGVRIMVPRKDHFEPPDLIQLEGDIDDCIPCMARILQIASSSSGGNANNNINAAYAGDTSKDTTNAKDSNSVNDSTSGPTPEKTKEERTVVVHNMPPLNKIKSIGKRTDVIIKKKRGDVEAQEAGGGAIGGVLLQVTGKSVEGVEQAVQLLEKWNKNSAAAAANNNANNANAKSSESAEDAAAAAESSSTPETSTPSKPRRGRRPANKSNKKKGSGGGGNNNKANNNNNSNNNNNNTNMNPAAAGPGAE